MRSTSEFVWVPVDCVSQPLSLQKPYFSCDRTFELRLFLSNDVYLLNLNACFSEYFFSLLFPLLLLKWKVILT